MNIIRYFKGTAVPEGDLERSLATLRENDGTSVRDGAALIKVIEQVGGRLNQLESQIRLGAREVTILNEQNEARTEEIKLLSGRVLGLDQENEALREEIERRARELEEYRLQTDARIIDLNNRLSKEERGKKRAELQGELQKWEEKLKNFDANLTAINPVGAGYGVVSGGILGGLLGGPPGAVFGSFLFGSFGGYVHAIDTSDRAAERTKMVKKIDETQHQLRLLG